MRGGTFVRRDGRWVILVHGKAVPGDRVLVRKTGGGTCLSICGAVIQERPSYTLTENDRAARRAELKG